MQSPIANKEKEIFLLEIDLTPQAIPSFMRRLLYRVGSIISLGLLPLAFCCLSRLLAKRILLSLNMSEDEKRNFIEIKQSFIKYEKKKIHEFDLKRANGTVINGMALFLNEACKSEFFEKASKNQKWVIFFNGNNGGYEKALLNAQSMGRDLNANVLVFNYRGVAESSGYPMAAEDLVADGEACVQYLFSKGAREENILIYGYSLGGAVGTHVAALHKKIALVNERSFASLAQLASHLVNNRWVLRLFQALNWELNSVSAYKKVEGAKLIVYHKKDYIIPYSEASLYKVLKHSIKKQHPEAIDSSDEKMKFGLKNEYKPVHVKLLRVFPNAMRDAHVYGVQNDEAYPKIQQFVKKVFALSY
jgi:hypothetical protein